MVWRAAGDKAFINRTALADPKAFVAEPDPPLASLRKLLAGSRIDLPRDLPPIAASVIGYMGYDMVRLSEHLPHVPPDSLGVPDVHEPLRPGDRRPGVLAADRRHPVSYTHLTLPTIYSV